MTVAIAAAMAGATIEATAEPARLAVLEMARSVRERFRGRRAEEEALARAVEGPDEPERVEALGGAVRRVLDEDPGFAAEVEAMWHQAQIRAEVSDDGIVNVFSGRAQKAAQLRDVHGDFNL